LYNFALLECMY